MHRLDWRVVGLSLGSFLALSFAACVAYDLAFGQRMYETWLGLLPGFTWITWGSFFLGLVESFAYGIYFALIFVPIYNYLQVKLGPREHS